MTPSNSLPAHWLLLLRCVVVNVIVARTCVSDVLVIHYTLPTATIEALTHKTHVITGDRRNARVRWRFLCKVIGAHTPAVCLYLWFPLTRRRGEYNKCFGMRAFGVAFLYSVRIIFACDTNCLTIEPKPHWFECNSRRLLYIQPDVLFM